MKTSIIFGLLLLASGVRAQTHSAVSRPKSYRIAREIKPPVLDIVSGTIAFHDADGNRAIDANEACSIRFDVSNTGLGDAYGCVVRVAAAGSTAAIVCRDVPLRMLPKGATRSVTIPIRAGMDTSDGEVEFRVQVDEPNGFGTDPQYIAVRTRAFVAPQLEVTDYTVTGGAALLEKKQPFDLQILLQNTRHGTAEDVRVGLELPEGIVLIDGARERSFASLGGGETRSIVYSLIASNNYAGASIPIRIRIGERHGRYGRDRTIDLAFHQTMSSRKIVIDDIPQQQSDIEIASLGSDVDTDIPKGRAVNAETFAVIIANENYRREERAVYALNDGAVFRKYCLETLGLPENNIHFYADATLNDIRAGVNWLEKVAEAYGGKANILFYYAGHGIPDERSATSYLLPTDGFGSDAQTGYKLADLYERMSRMPARSVILFLDACFSGAQRGGRLFASTRGVAIKAREERPAGNMVVFSAAEGDQTAYPYEEQMHGLFTYFLLKKLQLTRGETTLGELAAYLRENVSRHAIVDNMKSQTPTVIPAAGVRDWQQLKLVE